MLLQNSIQSIVIAECYRRVSLELHSLAVTIKIDPGYYRIFKSLEGLTAYDGSHDRDLHRSHFLSLCLGKSFLSPEGIILFLQTIEYFLYRCCPIHLICIRQNHSEYVFRSKTIL